MNLEPAFGPAAVPCAANASRPYNNNEQRLRQRLRLLESCPLSSGAATQPFIQTKKLTSEKKREKSKESDTSIRRAYLSALHRLWAKYLHYCAWLAARRRLHPLHFFFFTSAPRNPIGLPSGGNGRHKACRRKAHKAACRRQGRVYPETGETCPFSCFHLLFVSAGQQQKGRFDRVSTLAYLYQTACSAPR